MQGNSLFPIKQGRSLDLLNGNTVSPLDIPQTARSTLMSTQEYEIVWGCPNQLEMMTDSPAMASEQSPIPHHTGEVA